MARDSIKISVIIKTLIVEIFFDAGHSQYNDAPSTNTATDLFCLTLIIITVE